MVEKILSRSVRLMFTGGLVLSAQLVGAQEAAPMQKVEVTGTRIPTINVDGPSPVTVLSAKDIKVDGVRNVEDLLNNLPQVFADQGGQIVNGATGTATVALRGLGADRTLVLVNGKRLPAGSTSSSSADLNEIPTGLIKRVDILTGGAGAVYGAGAVAGVVNFILKDNFQGVEVQANVSGNNHKQQQDYVTSIVTKRGFATPGNVNYDGKIQDASILFGSNFADNKGNATLYFAYKKTDAILQAARDYSACSLASNATGFACSGSGTPALGRVGLTAGGGTFVADENGVTRPFVTATDQYNFGPINHLQRPSEQYLFNAQGHFDINDKVRVYEEFNFHSNHTDAQIAASGAFFGGIIATLSSDNPLLSASWKERLKLTTPGSTAEVFVGKRNIEGGGRILDITDSSMRNVLGVKGEVSNWSYDAFAQIGRVNHNSNNFNYFDNNKINKALDVVVGANGEAVCRSFADGSDPACVPYNVYKKGGVTKAQTDYLAVTGLAGGFTQQTVLGASIGSDLSNYGIKLPTAQSGVGVSFGVENRTESLGYVPDAATAEGSLAGSGGPSPALAGKFSVKEYFGEVKVPLMEKRPFAESLEASGSYRNSDYSTGRKTNTWGLGLDYAPVKSVRIRASHQVAVRAPTIFDLYTPKGIGLGGPANDPCEGDAPTASAAACANTGMSAAQYGHTIGNAANQHNASFGGNVNVNPENAKTDTIGFVIEPIKNLVFTVDAFKIKIDGTISSIDPTTILSQCMKTGSATFCNLIHRDKFGSIWLTNDGFIEGNTTNIGSVSTSGVDIAASYGMKMGAMGGLNLSLNGTLLDTLEVENIPGLGKYNCVGYFGQSCGTPTAKWKHKMRASWATPWNLDASLTWRHIDSVKHERLSANPLLAGTVNPIEAGISAREYFDLNAAYALTKNLSLSAGVTNLFDKDPPILSTNATSTAGAANGNTYPQVYESLGRKIYVNLTAKF